MTLEKTMIYKKIRIYKFDRISKIKDFIYSTGQSSQLSQINVLLGDDEDFFPPYALVNGSISTTAFQAPFGYRRGLSEYVFRSRHVLIRDQLYLFGGHTNYNKVMQVLVKDI